METVTTELGVFGMSICYDVRFPELYRLLALKERRSSLSRPALQKRRARPI